MKFFNTVRPHIAEVYAVNKLLLDGVNIISNP